MSGLVVLESFVDAIEANIVKGRLEAEGIRVFIADDNLIWINWSFSHAIGGVKLKVLEQDLPRAADMLEKYRRGEYACEEGQDEDAGVGSESDECTGVDSNSGEAVCCRCLVCGSTDIKKVFSFSSIVWLVLSILFFFVVLRPRKKEFLCRSCGVKWKD